MICVAAVAQRRRYSDGVRIKKRAPVLRELFLKIFPQQEKDLITPPSPVKISLFALPVRISLFLLRHRIIVVAQRRRYSEEKKKLNLYGHDVFLLHLGHFIYFRNERIG